MATTLPLSQIDAKVIWDNLLNMLKNCQSYSLTFQSQVTANAVDPQNVLGMTNWAGQAIQYIATVEQNSAQSNAVIAYVQQIYNAPTLSVGTIVNNISAALQTVLNSVNTDFPHDGSGNLLYQKFSTTTGVPTVATTAASIWPNTQTAVTNWLALVS